MSDRGVIRQGHETASALLAAHVVDRLWRRDPTVWADDAGAQAPAAAAAIANRLGWLTAPSDLRPQVERVRALASAARAESFRRALLLGMGGSSLCAEVLRNVFGVTPGFLDLDVLDTTDPRTVHAARLRMQTEATLLLVASKSGTTVEVSALERFFSSDVAKEKGREAAGRSFVAITDPGTPLVALAAREGFREIFLNPADIGGRFSALSLFGLVPAGLIGAPLDDLLAAGEAMAEGCRQNNHANPGLELGALLGAAAHAGRDKLTLVLPPSLASFGSWVEQLVAESTGKSGRGVLPIVDEPIGDPSTYGADRLFVYVSTDHDAPALPSRDWLAAIERAGHPVLRLTTRARSIGAEFFRWEFAVAIAGAVLHVNPFDEPNVTEAKDRTRQLLDTFARQGRLPEEAPLAVDGGVAAFGSPGLPAPGVGGTLRHALRSVRPGDYVAVLSYLPGGEINACSLAGTRAAIRTHTRAATTCGIGPRYLHSTGQYHKGGPDTGVFLLITGDEPEGEEPIAGLPYSFGVLKRAQALGDYQALRDRGRRVVRLHLDATVTDPSETLRALIDEALTAA